MSSKLLCGELPHGLEHRESFALPADQALVNERLELVDVRIADLFGGLERAAPVEGRETFEQPLLVRLKEVVAPCDGRPQSLLPRIDPAPGLEEVQSFGESGEQLPGRQDPDPRGRQLQRQRQVVELSAQLLNDWAGLEPGIGRLGATDEE